MLYLHYLLEIRDKTGLNGKLSSFENLIYNQLVIHDGRQGKAQAIVVDR